MVFPNDYWQQKYRRESCKSWNLFYRRNNTHFFKDRHWTLCEFPELNQVRSILEVGCGVGNFILPLLQECENIEKAWACDFSERAVELLREDARCDGRVTAFVADVTRANCFIDHNVEMVDAVSAIFVLSAIPPESLLSAIMSVHSVLKQGGIWIIRDYAKGDAAQGRFNADRRLDHDLFVRQDGTLSRFFDKDHLTELLSSNGFSILSAEIVKSRTTNHAKGIDQERHFLQIKCNKS